MRRLSLMLIVGAAVTAQMDLVYAQQSPGQIMSAGCSDDAKKFCSDVQPGEGRIVACLRQNKESLSDQCKQAAAQASRMARSGSQSGEQAPAALPNGSTAAPGDAAAVADNTSLAGGAASGQSAGTGGSTTTHARAGSAMASSAGPSAVGSGAGYLVLKKVQVTGAGIDAAHPTMPAFSLLIPPTWKMKGGIVFGGLGGRGYRNEHLLFRPRLFL